MNRIKNKNTLTLLFVFTLFIGFSPSVFAITPKEDEVQVCQSSREYVTAIQYLRKTKEFKMQEKQRRDLADQVSTGCSGAAKRFVVTTKLLLSAGLDSSSALQKGLHFAKSTEDKFQIFIHIFKRTYLKEELDLTLQEALNMATNISESLTEFSKTMRKTFDSIIDACKEELLPLPAKRCAERSSKVTQLVEKFRAPLGTVYVRLYQFLTSKSGPHNGPNLPTYKALEMTNELISFGPMIHQNFKVAYKFAAKDDGLGLNRSQAIDFAKKMTKRSFRVEKSH